MGTNRYLRSGCSQHSMHPEDEAVRLIGRFRSPLRQSRFWMQSTVRTRWNRYGDSSEMRPSTLWGICAGKGASALGDQQELDEIHQYAIDL